MNRQMWAAVLAKWASPMDWERGAKALGAMLPGLSRYPDAAFTQDSAWAVAKTGRIMSDGSRAPLGRVPTMGELDDALGRWWYEHGPKRELPAIGQDRVEIPKPRDPPTEAEVEYVGGVVQALHRDLRVQAMEREPTMMQPRVVKHIPRPMTDEQLIEIYKRAGPAGTKRLQMLREKIAAESAAAMKARVAAAQTAALQAYYPDHDRHDEAYSGAQFGAQTDAENERHSEA